MLEEEDKNMRNVILVFVITVLLGSVCEAAGWTTLDFPGANDTHAYGIDGSNIVGYCNNGPSSFGFLYDGTDWTRLDSPGATRTAVFGIDGGNIVGYYDSVHGVIGGLKVR